MSYEREFKTRTSPHRDPVPHQSHARNGFRNRGRPLHLLIGRDRTVQADFLACGNHGDIGSIDSAGNGERIGNGGFQRRAPGLLVFQIELHAVKRCRLENHS